MLLWEKGRAVVAALEARLVRRFLAVGKERGLGLGLGEGWMILVIHVHDLFSVPARANHRGAAANANS